MPQLRSIVIEKIGSLSLEITKEAVIISSSSLDNLTTLLFLQYNIIPMNRKPRTNLRSDQAFSIEEYTACVVDTH